MYELVGFNEKRMKRQERRRERERESEPLKSLLGSKSLEQLANCEHKLV